MHFEFVASQFAEQALTMFNVTEEGIAFVAENVSGKISNDDITCLVNV